ncbi:MAG: hypothetical protein E6J43_08145 [Chloroflexi bacterium]|nr:MAG: hypothetical protein E6J43_08145 [Chloroflexota bacterium]
MGCATSDAIQDAFFGRWPSATQRSLAGCFEMGYLNKLRGRAVNEPDVYYVSPSAKRGYALAEEVLAAEDKKPALGLARLAARFLRSCRESGLVFREWRSERELRPVPELGQLVPDAYLRIARSEGQEAKPVSFFVEWEASDKPVSYWDQKFRRYVAIYDSELYDKAFGTSSLRILILVAPKRHGPGRLNRLAAAAERAGATMARLADWRELRSAPAADVLRAPLWTKPGRDERISLFPSEER